MQISAGVCRVNNVAIAYLAGISYLPWLKRRYLLIGAILLSASITGFFITYSTRAPYAEYAYNNLYVPPDIERQANILEAIEFGFAVTFVVSLILIIYGAFAKDSLDPKQRVA